jgi:sec-independent protein translocase protein TatC
VAAPDKSADKTILATSSPPTAGNLDEGDDPEETLDSGHMILQEGPTPPPVKAAPPLAPVKTAAPPPPPLVSDYPGVAPSAATAGDDVGEGHGADGGAGDGGGGGDSDGDGDGDAASGEDEGLDDKRMTLLEHLSELRVRLRNAAIAFIVAMVASFVFVQRFFEWLTRPVRAGLKAAGFPAELHAIGVTEPFWVFMKLAIVAGLLIAAPFVCWELWKFIAPGLYKKEKRLAGLVTGATAFCFAAGAVFGYAVLCEPAVYYMMLLTKVTEGDLAIKPMLTMEHVGNFLMLTLAGCGAAFELPVVVSMLGWMGIVSAGGLWRFNKYALILSAVVGAVLTPSTDPFTQILLAGPLFGLYNLSIVIVWMLERTRKRKQEELDRAAA